MRTAILTYLAASALLLFTGANIAQGAPEVGAELSPRRVGVGEDAEFAIVVSGVTSSPTPRLPAVTGLEFRSLGQTMNMELRNGTMESEVRHRYLVSSQRPGRYEIPSISLEIDRTTYTTPSFLLEVTAASALSRATTEPPAIELELHGLPDRPLWVGELLPAEVTLYVRNGLRVSEATPPRAHQGNFTLVQPRERQPEQRAVRRHGVRYSELVFRTALSPAQAGEQAFQVAMDVTVLVPTQRRQRRGSLDPFFDSFFARTTEQKVSTTSRAQPLVVRNLPLANQPPDFSGGIGSFSLEAAVAPERLEAGDPLSLTTRVRGRGNFDRLQVPDLVANEKWKTYPGVAEFVATDDLGISGEKSFEQAVIPLGTGPQVLPGPSLSFFNPINGVYERTSAANLPVEVRAAATTVSPRDTPNNRVRARRFELAPNRVVDEKFATRLLPMSDGPFLLPLQITPIFLTVAVIAWRRFRKKRREDPKRRRRKAILERLASTGPLIDAAQARGDVATMLLQTREAVEDCVRTHAAYVERNPGIERTLAALNDPELASEIRELFQAADEAAYSTQASSVRDPGSWRPRIDRILAKLPGALLAILLCSSLLVPRTDAKEAAPSPLVGSISANQAFAEGRYEDALRELDEIVHNRGVSAPLLFNLGNSALRAGHPGTAILAYERAALLDSRNGATLANLRQARQVAQVEIGESDLWTATARRLSPDEWAWAATLLLWLACLLVLWKEFRPTLPHTPLVLGIAALSLTLCWSLFATRLELARRAVVVGESAALLGAPFPSAIEESELRSGETVWIETEHDGFALIRTKDGRSGWTKPGSVAAISPLR